MKSDWETVIRTDKSSSRSNNVWRMRIPGGWLYRHTSSYRAESMVFVPRSRGEELIDGEYIELGR